MHRSLKALLEEAHYTSEMVVTVVIDMRGFSSFCERVDSAEVASFVKKAYRKLLGHFRRISFFKLTGDGLLIVISYKENALRRVADSAIRNSLEVAEKFGLLFVSDPEIADGAPRAIGIGVSSGSACRLMSKGKILDYSGRPLNIASRLMDMARPCGVVFDGRLIKTLAEDLRGRFEKEDVFLPGISQHEPFVVYYSSQLTLIPERYKHKLGDYKWQTEIMKIRMKHVGRHKEYWIVLQGKPADLDQIELVVGTPKSMWNEVGGSQMFYQGFRCRASGGKYVLMCDFGPLNRILRGEGLRDGHVVAIQVTYPMTVTQTEATMPVART